MNISGISPTQATQNLVTSALQAPINSAVLLAKLVEQLNIQVPTALEAKVLAAGNLSNANLPSTLTQTLNQAPSNTNTLNPTDTLKLMPASSSHPTTGLQWARLQIANSPAILVVSQSVPSAMQVGQILSVILDNNGKLTYASHASSTNATTQTAATLNTANPVSMATIPTTLTSTTVKSTTTNTIPTINTTTGEATKKVKTENKGTAAEIQQITRTIDIKASPEILPARPATLSAIAQLSQTLSQQINLNTASPNRNSQTPANTPQSLPSSAGLSAATQLNNALQLLPPSLQQQLLPPKIQALLGQISLQPTSPTLAAELNEALKPTTIDATMINLQGVVALLKRVVGNDKIPLPNTTTFLSLIGNLPSVGAKHEQIQQSRIAIAKWLAGEFTSAITQRSLNHSASLQQQAATPDTFFMQQDMPLKWGDAIANLHVVIEERRESPENSAKKATKNRAKSQQWSVMMTLELPEDKTLGVEIKLAAAEVDIDLWSSDSVLLNTITSHIEDLKSSLESAGLTIHSLECRQGQRPSQQQGLSQTLIDVIT